jgi:hypothetical protein
MTDYLAQLGYQPADDVPDTTGRPIPRALCVACGAMVVRAGNVMRSHRRRCPVAPGDPYTPGVCDA